MEHKRTMFLLGINMCCCVCTEPVIERKSAVGLLYTAIQKKSYPRQECGLAHLSRWPKDHSADISIWGTEIADGPVI